MLTGNLAPTSGDFTWRAKDQSLSSKAIRQNLGVVFQDNRLDPLLTVQENLETRGKMYGLKSPEIEQRLQEIDQYLDLKATFDQRFGSLSGGQKRKCEIARALINHPQFLILDEPTTGLDPQTRLTMWQAISRLHQEQSLTLILVSHYLEEMTDCDEIVVLLQGQIDYTGSVQKFIQHYSQNELEIEVATTKARPLLKEQLAPVYPITWVTPTRFKVEAAMPTQMIAVLNLVESITEIIDFQVSHATLERSYLNLLHVRQEQGGR
ncbi:ABC transporter ATP-binding protein [Bombilactobacillus apium]|uniref:ABC transporter ATP-binding protein n=1 Tax=Bombilactobacillus apium TaxID=2675299 RepID=UPI002B4B8D97|nr:ABC transporter ATP-binding protein [Bombilactobacillus apium]